MTYPGCTVGRADVVPPAVRVGADSEGLFNRAGCITAINIGAILSLDGRKARGEKKKDGANGLHFGGVKGWLFCN